MIDTAQLDAAIPGVMDADERATADAVVESRVAVDVAGEWRRWR